MHIEKVIRGSRGRHQLSLHMPLGFGQESAKLSLVVRRLMQFGSRHMQRFESSARIVWEFGDNGLGSQPAAKHLVYYKCIQEIVTMHH